VKAEHVWAAVRWIGRAAQASFGAWRRADQAPGKVSAADEDLGSRGAVSSVTLFELALVAVYSGGWGRPGRRRGDAAGGMRTKGRCAAVRRFIGMRQGPCRRPTTAPIREIEATWDPRG